MLTAVPLVVRGKIGGSYQRPSPAWQVFLLLGNSSWIALISYIHVTMQNLHFHRPWRTAAGVEPPWLADICSCNICISNIHAGRFKACRWWLRPIHVSD